MSMSQIIEDNSSRNDRDTRACRMDASLPPLLLPLLLPPLPCPRPPPVDVAPRREDEEDIDIRCCHPVTVAHWNEYTLL